MKKLRKSRNKWIDGVLGGLGEYFQVNADILRVAFIILLALNIQGVIAIYIILMIFMPSRKQWQAEEDGHLEGDYDTSEVDDWDEDDSYDDDEEDDDEGYELQISSGRSMQFFGILLVFIGVYVLFRDQIDIYRLQFYAQLRDLRYYIIPYREGILAGILILAGGLIWWKGRK